MIKKDFIILALLLFISIVLCVLGFGYNQFIIKSTIQISFRDTNYVLNSFYLLLVTFFVLNFVTFFIRSILKKHKSISSSVILIFSTIILLLLCNKLSTIIEIVNHQNNGWSIYPPLSSGVTEQLIEDDLKNVKIFKQVSLLLLIIQISLLLSLTFFSINLGLNFKNKTFNRFV